MLRSRRTKYMDAYTCLRLMMQREELHTGQKMPTERELCERFGCSRRTVRKALDMLAAEGKIQQRQGAGTFVLTESCRTSYLDAPLDPRIGILVPTVGNSEIVRLVHAIEWRINAYGGISFVGVTNDTLQMELDLIDYFAGARVGAVVKFPTVNEGEQTILERLHFYRMRCVRVNDFWNDVSKVPHIAYDEVGGINLIVDRLVALGHTRIVYVDSNGWPRLAAIEAFRAALARHGLPHDEQTVLLVAMYSRPLPMERLFGLGRPNPTAIVTAYTLTARRVVSDLLTAGLRIPDDVSVANLNGSPICWDMPMALGGAEPPDAELAAAILAVIKGELPLADGEQLLFPMSFAEKESCGPAPAHGSRIAPVARPSAIPMRKEVTPQNDAEVCGRRLEAAPHA